MMIRRISYSCDDTFEYGKKLATKLSKGAIVCLDGELGVGKTVFVQGLAKGLGIDEYISSPTFTIVNVYGDKLNHFDAYRIGSSDEILDIGFDEYISTDAISVIEWAELIKDVIPSDAIWIKINRSNENDDWREICTEVNDEHFWD